MSLKRKAIDGVKWSSISSIVVAFIQLIQIIVLSRYLDSADFGLIAIVIVVIGFSTLFMDMGISSAIIHNQKISHVQLSSLYWLNIISGTVLALLVYLIAPIISMFYNELKLTPLIRILSLTFIISSIGNQYRVLYQKELKFNFLAKVEVVSTFLGFVVAFLCALFGLGVYSLIYATLTKTFLANSMYFFSGLKKHKPLLNFNYGSIKSMIRFGLFQMGERSINYFNSQFDTILIGKLLGLDTLGIYTIAKTIVMKPAQIINPVITKVSFPVMAKVQNDELKLRRIYLEMINYLCSINGPIYIALIVMAKPIVMLLFGKNWIDAVPILQILSIYFVLRATVNPIGSLQLAKGRADLGFYWNAILFIVNPIVIYIGSYYGVLGVAYSLVILSLLLLIPSWYYMVAPLCGAKFKEYFSMIIIPYFIALFLGFLSVNVSYFVTSPILSYSLFVFLFFFTYVFTNRLLNTPLYCLYLSALKKDRDLF